MLAIQIFQPTIPAEIINSLDNTDKTCTLGPLPTKQLNNNTEDVVPIITRITFHPRMQSCLCRYVTNVLNAILDNREITSHVLIDFKCWLHQPLGRDSAVPVTYGIVGKTPVWLQSYL